MVNRYTIRALSNYTGFIGYLDTEIDEKLLFQLTN
jgi:hypothetical protein